MGEVAKRRDFPMSDQNRHPATILSDGQVQQFIQDGFVRLDHAFPRR